MREAGAHLAHKAYDEITELANVVPQLCEEIKAVSTHCLPTSMLSDNSPTDNYEKLVTKGHEIIDTIFSTDQADLFTKSPNDNLAVHHFAVGIIPLPTDIPELFANTSNLLKAGNVIDRAGRGLMKHGYRKDSIFPKPMGNPAQVNKQGEACLQEILNDPKRTIVKNDRGGIEIYSQRALLRKSSIGIGGS